MRNAAMGRWSRHMAVSGFGGPRVPQTLPLRPRPTSIPATLQTTDKQELARREWEKLFKRGTA